MPSFPELSQPLGDGTVSVRFAAERDIPEVLIAYQDDSELHVRMGEDRPPTGAELGRRAEGFEADRLAGRGLTLTIVESGVDTCRGQIYVHRVDWDNGQADLAVWVAPGYRGRGLAQRGLAPVGPWLLSQAGLERVQLFTRPDNQPMLRAAVAAGFSLEGVLRGYHRSQRGRDDMAVLSLVRRDLGT